MTAYYKRDCENGGDEYVLVKILGIKEETEYDFKKALIQLPNGRLEEINYNELFIVAD